MEQQPKSEGKCLFCGKTFAKAGINRHLKTHLEQKTVENSKEKSYLVKIESDPRWSSSSYFLSLWVDGKASMENIDGFLRNIWLEYCGHLSVFRKPQSRMQGDEVPMSRKVDKIFHKDLKLEYDFDSATALLLIVLEEYSVKADDKIVLLSRNEPLEWLCNSCKQRTGHPKRMGVCAYDGGRIDTERDGVFAKK
jgi:hypothetical protein